MKLYSNAFAPSPRRLRLFLAEKGLEVPVVELDFARGEQSSPEFLALNPLGEVPALVLDDGRVLTESIATCRWLEALHPEPNLFGRTPDERYAVDRWVDRIQARLYEPVRQAFRNTHRYWVGRITQVPEFGALAREAAASEMRALDAALAGREYLALERYSFADLALLCALDFGKPSGLRPGPELPELARWHAAVSARPASRA